MSRSLGTVGPPPGLTAVPVEDATEEDSRVAVAESVRLPEPLALGLGVPVAVVEVAPADDHDHEPRNRQRIFFQKKTTTNFPFSRKPFSKLKKTFKQPLKKKGIPHGELQDTTSTGCDTIVTSTIFSRFFCCI